jgi:hypothetical protein
MIQIYICLILCREGKYKIITISTNNYRYYYLLHSSENAKRNSMHTVTNCVIKEHVTDAVDTAAKARD